MTSTYLNGCDFKDVYLIPQYSEIQRRSEVDISVVLSTSRMNWRLDIPVISSNMDTVTDGNMAKAMFSAHAAGAIHRFMSIEENVKEYQKVKYFEERLIPVHGESFVSVGVNRDSKERTDELYKQGARFFVIDIAHGHSKMMREMIFWMKERYNDIFVMAGNVATHQGADHLARWGADAIKVGIGPGAVCLTKNVTGVTVPQLGAIKDCSNAVKNLSLYKRPLIVADGGIREYGDVAKALGAGADMVMIGGLFAGTDEAPGQLINGKKVYRGMASKEAMSSIRIGETMPTPEGTSILVDTKGSVRTIVEGIAGGLRSAFSYSNARTLHQFQNQAKFGIRK